MALAFSSTPAPRFLPQRLPRVCLALSGDTVEDMLATAESMARDNPFLEFRLDYLKQPLAALPKIHRFLETHQYVTAIGTCRRADNGGKFKGSLASQLEVLTKAHAAGCQIVDLELQSALKSKPEAIARLRSRAGLILSFHDFRATRNLDETLEKMLKIPADFYKVVTTATALSDNVAMMKFLQAQSGQACADRIVHGRARHHQPRARRARRQRFHLWRDQRRSQDRARPGQCAGSAQLSTASIKSTPPLASMESPAIPSSIRSRPSS